MVQYVQRMNLSNNSIEIQPNCLRVPRLQYTFLNFSLQKIGPHRLNEKQG
jgi:hypothetical protein